MHITIELIDEMRKRTNCSYQEAKELLEKHNGDIIEAIIEFEKSQPHRSRHCPHTNNSSFGATIKKLIHKGSVTRFIIEKNAETYLNIPIIILVLIVLVTMPIIWFYLVLVAALYIMGYKIRIKRSAGQIVEINEIMDDLSNKVKAAAEKVNEKPASQTDNKKSAEKKDQDNGENEIIIQ
jgi:NACalpha-BTF3-like transcription factor